MKKILITGGKMRTVVKMDSVRTMTIENEASGETAVEMARHFAGEGWQVTVVLFVDVKAEALEDFENVWVIRYESYHDLYNEMESEICSGGYNAVIHSSAVSDYIPNGDVIVEDSNGNQQIIQAKGKMSSSFKMIAPCMVQTEKILTKIKGEWEFQGVVVCFKLESEIFDEELVRRAYKKISSGAADVVVANLQRWARDYFYLVEKGVAKPKFQGRRNLYKRVYGRVEELME